MSGVPINLLTAATTGTGSAVAIPSSFRHHNFMVTAIIGTTAGAVTIEASNDPADASTWAAIVMDKSVANPITVSAAADLLMPYSGLLNFVRARVSTTVAGTTPAVTVVYEGAKSY
jgi:hypothetical protein